LADIALDFFALLFDRKSASNEERYWKKIIIEQERLKPEYSRLEELDGFLKKLPLMKRLAWNLAVVATK